MILIAFILSLIFCSLGFIVTRNNAKYILSGYNTMFEADRAKIDIESYLKFFKHFHIFLSGSLFTGVLLLSWINNNWASLFMTTYPLLAYLYFLIIAGKSSNILNTQKAGTYVTGGILLLTVMIIARQGVIDYRSSDLILQEDVMEINGSYGLKLNKHDIHKQELVNELPPISYRSNGFAAGNYAKGSFKLKNGKTVKLFVNKKISPTLLLRTSKGIIYYNTDEADMYLLNEKVKKWRES